MRSSRSRRIFAFGCSSIGLLLVSARAAPVPDLASGAFAGPASYAGPVGSMRMGQHEMITGTQHQQRFTLMRCEGDREGVQVVDLADLLISEHVDQNAAWHQGLRGDASRNGMGREVQHRDLLSIG